MPYSLIEYLLLGLASIIISGLLTPVARKFAQRIGAMDKPNLDRKTQKEPVPYLGGLSIALTITLLTYTVVLVEEANWSQFRLASYVIVPALILTAVGLLDDLRGLTPWPRLIVQSLTGLVVAVILIQTETMSFAFGNTFIDGLVTILWIVGICNSINFFDNIDGGASGTVAIIGLSIFLIGFSQGQILVSASAVVTTGAVIGFLAWNKPPAKIYMGDAGALFLGVMVSVLTIRLDPGISPSWQSLAIPVLMLAVPILDTSVAVFSRWQRGISPFTGGRDHLSHRLIRIGFTHKKAAISLWALTGVFCGAALAVYQWPGQVATAAIILSGLTWLALIVSSLKIASEDSISSNNEMK
jgi:UDP-GlcNAc:undecaprenyl-phosphate/decaprenyl-phosphate GlcNAc-1-phosphate transferase